MFGCCCVMFFFFFKQKTAYEMRISDWSSDVCSSDLDFAEVEVRRKPGRALDRRQVARGVIIGDFGQEVPERGLRAFLARGPDVKSLGPVGAPGQQLPVGERLSARRLRQRLQALRRGLGLVRRHLRSEERSGGKEWGSTCRTRWSAEH